MVHRHGERVADRLARGRRLRCVCEQPAETLEQRVPDAFFVRRALVLPTVFSWLMIHAVPVPGRELRPLLLVRMAVVVLLLLVRLLRTSIRSCRISRGVGRFSAWQRHALRPALTPRRWSTRWRLRCTTHAFRLRTCRSLTRDIVPSRRIHLRGRTFRLRTCGSLARDIVPGGRLIHLRGRTWIRIPASARRP